MICDIDCRRDFSLGIRVWKRDIKKENDEIKKCEIMRKKS